METKTILSGYESAIRQALFEELQFNNDAGSDYGHYWLHLRLDQIIREAEKRFLLNESTPYFPIKKETVIR